MRKAVPALFVIAVMIVFVLPAIAGEKPLTPESIDGVTVVDDAWVKGNLDKVKVFDVRKKAEYVEGHLPGAVSNPYKEKSERSVSFDSSQDSIDMDKFPSDKNASILVYCNGPRCWKSYKAAVLLKRAGYKNISWYRNDGFPGWKAKGYPVE